MQYGEIRRGYLGVYIDPMNTVRAKGVGLDKPRGVFVSSIVENGAAAKAGVKQGDVILEVNGSPVNQTNELQAKVASYNPGDKVNLLIWRDGREIKLKATLENLNGEVLATTGPRERKQQKLEEIGLNVRDMNEQELDNLDLDSGILIQSVKNYSVAREAGLNARETIYEIDGNEVESVGDFQDYLSKFSSGDGVKLKVRSKDRDGKNFDRLIFMEIP